MAAPGQRIHPAGSRRPDPHAASAATAALDPNRQHDACGVGLRRLRVRRPLARRRVDGARGRRASRAPRRGLDRQLRRRRGIAHADPASAVLSRRLPPGPASPARVALRRRLLLPATRAAGAGRIGQDDRARFSRRTAFRSSAGATCRPSPRRSVRPRWRPARSSARSWWDVPRSRPTRMRGSARCTSRDVRWSDRRRSEIFPASTSAPSPAAPSSTRLFSPGLSSPPSSPTSAIPSTRAPSRSSTSATRRTPCRAGHWRSRSGFWRTTARSTPSGATGTR